MLMKFPAASACACALLFASACSQSPQRLVEAGNRYHEKKKYREASILYRKAVAKDKTYAEAYYREGVNLLDEKNAGEAAKFFRRAVDLNPKNTDAEIKLSEIYLTAYAYDQKKFRSLLPEVRELTKKILDRNPKDFHGIRLQAFLYLTDKDLPKALERFELANQLQPYSREVVGWLAQVLVAANQFDKAEELCRSMIAHDKTWGPAYDFLFVQYMQRKRPADAEALLKERVANDPGNETALNNYANYLLQNNRYTEAETEIHKALAGTKSFPDGRKVMGDFYMRAGKLDDAIAQYRAGIEAQPKEKLTYQLRLVGALARQGSTAPAKRAEALDLAKKLAAENPKDTSATELYASLLLGSGAPQDVDKSIVELKALLDKNNDDPTLHFDLARAYYSQNDYDKALRESLEAVRLRPSYMPARILTARIYEDRGQHGKALEQTGIVLDRTPNDPQAQLVRARALMGLKDIGKAQPELEALVKRNPNFADAVNLLATLYLSEREYGKAQEQYQKLWEGTGPGARPDLRGFIGLQEIKLRQGHWEEAVQSLENLAQKNPGQATLRYTLANFQALAAASMPDSDPQRKPLLTGAEQNYKQVAASSAHPVDVLLRLGTVQRMLNEKEASLASYEQASKASPGNAEALLNRAMTLEAMGQIDKARDVYNQTLGVDPDNVLALNNLAFLNAERNQDLDQAMSYAERAKKRVPNNPNISDTLGYIYFRKNLTEDAVRELQAAVKGDPKNPSYRLHLAMALLKRGDKSGARREAESALQSADTGQQEKIRSFLNQIS